MKKRHLILAVLAIVLVLCASIGAASAYFTTYADARGGYVIHLSYETKIDEEVDAGVKKVWITNEPKGDTGEGLYPIFVRARVFHGNDSVVTVAGSPTGWAQGTDRAFYFDTPLYTGDSTTILQFDISVADGANVKPGDPVDVIVTFESVPAVFKADGTPDMETSWANASAIQTING